MLQFLSMINVPINVINDMNNTYSKSVLYSIEGRQNDVIEIIKYFREIGITVINELLAFELEVFFSDCKEIKEKFSKYDIKSIVDNVNDDYEKIFDYLN